MELTDALGTGIEAADRSELLEKDKTLLSIEEGLLELNEEQKRCVILFYLQKKSYQEITDITGFNLSQVKSYIQNGKRNLKLIVEKKMKKANG
jgi:RNA polymerase sigma-70 factor (ECF subfamily)